MCIDDLVKTVRSQLLYKQDGAIRHSLNAPGEALKNRYDSLP